MRVLKKNKPKMLIHVSIDKDLKEITPRIPDCAIEGTEDRTIERCCFSDDIDKCLKAIGPICSTYYVYVAILRKDQKIFKPSKKEVFDSFLTSEVWTVEPTQVVCVGSIKIKGIYKTIKYHVNQKPYIIHNHIYDWSWIEKYECYEKCFGKYKFY